MAFTPQQIRAGLQVDPFTVRVEKVATLDEWAITWATPGTDDVPSEEVAIAGFREVEDGIEWIRFHVREVWRGRGIYTQALKWSMDLGVDVHTFAEGLNPDEWDGFKEHKSGRLKMDLRQAKARVKGV